MLHKLTIFAKGVRTLERTKIEKLHFNMRKVGHKSRHLQMQHYQNIGDLRMLRIIAHHGRQGIIPSQLAERMEVALPTVSRKLNVLEKQRLIERKPCKTDKRKSFIYITRKGKQLVEEDWVRFINSFSNVCEKMGEEKTALLTGLLQEFNKYLDEEIHREEDDG